LIVVENILGETTAEMEEECKCDASRNIQEELIDECPGFFALDLDTIPDGTLIDYV
jgi:hypothetical protein